MQGAQRRHLLALLDLPQQRLAGGDLPHMAVRSLDTAISAIRLRPANAAPAAILSLGGERANCLLTLNRDD